MHLDCFYHSFFTMLQSFTHTQGYIKAEEGSANTTTAHSVLSSCPYLRLPNLSFLRGLGMSPYAMSVVFSRPCVERECGGY